MNKKFYKKNFSLIKTGLCSFAAVLFSLTFIYVQEYNLANALNKETLGCSVNIGNKAGGFAKYNSNPIHTDPLVSLLVLNETESTEEDEVNEVSENKNENFSNRFYSLTCSTYHKKSLNHQLVLYIQNRNSVALFILFHSWKSFLF